MNTYETQGYYGSHHTPCTIFAYETRGITWYCVEDSSNVNATYEPVEIGVDVETLADCDCFTAGQPIESLDELETAVDS